MCERIPTIGTQLKILSTVKATMLGAQGREFLLNNSWIIMVCLGRSVKGGAGNIYLVYFHPFCLFSVIYILPFFIWFLHLFSNIYRGIPLRHHNGASSCLPLVQFTSYYLEYHCRNRGRYWSHRNVGWKCPKFDAVCEADSDGSGGCFHQDQNWGRHQAEVGPQAALVSVLTNRSY